MTIAPADRGPQVLAVYCLFVVLTTITMSLRMYCRIFLQKAFGLDDCFAAAAWVFFIVFAAMAIEGVFHGTGQHAWEIHPATEIPQALKFWWICEPVYVISNMTLKASIAVMLLRLCVRPTHRIIVWVTFIVTELYSIFFFFMFLFQCNPSFYFWTRYLGKTGSCINPDITAAATYGYSAVSCAGDWTFSILPVFIVRDLQLERKEKLSVIAILALGALASAATIARFPYVKGFRDQTDFLYSTTDVAIWSCCETGLGITATACATLRPLIRRFFPKWSLTASSRSRSEVSKPSYTSSGDAQRILELGDVQIEELKLDPLDREKGFGTKTSVWHDCSENDLSFRGFSSDGVVVETTTSVHHVEEH